MFIYKTSYLNEEVNFTEHSPSVGIPWFVLGKPFQFSLHLKVKAEPSRVEPLSELLALPKNNLNGKDSTVKML